MAIKKHKTEGMLLASIGILSIFLFASAFTKEIAGTKVFAEESSGASGSNDEGSQEDEKSDDSDEDEESQEDEKSEPSVASTSSTAGTEVSEASVKSSTETSQASQVSQSTEGEEVSEASAPSEVSQEISEESIKHVEGYGDVVSKEGNVALVKKDGKLFFLIPVEIESQVTLDEQGSVVSEEKSFLNWLLSAFSF